MEYAQRPRGSLPTNSPLALHSLRPPHHSPFILRFPTLHWCPPSILLVCHSPLAAQCSSARRCALSAPRSPNAATNRLSSTTQADNSLASQQLPTWPIAAARFCRCACLITARCWSAHYLTPPSALPDARPLPTRLLGWHLLLSCYVTRRLRCTLGVRPYTLAHPVDLFSSCHVLVCICHRCT
jgi:hypothetical protein